MKGFILFVISEICIFLTLFYTFLYSSIIPDIHIGNVWPPIGIETINYKSIPLLNTILLFFSGITITIAQYKIKEGNIKESRIYILYTLILGLLFVYMQYIEYKYSIFNITDSIYSNIFYTLTGFHGIHVIMGIFFILIAYLRLSQYTIIHHMNFILSAIYYHFVDIVWLFLYALLYIWSTGIL
jgi:heme/copper-type cytochrome/quinol oxidase subunit 3